MRPFQTVLNGLEQKSIKMLPNYELGICGIIHNVFQGDYTTKQKFENGNGKFHGNN